MCDSYEHRIYTDHVLACMTGIANPVFNLTNFDTIFYSWIIVFEIVTLEGWSDIMYKIFDAFTVIAVIFFLLVVFIGSFFLW
jgi:voltage-dependent calcium channel T type alpha-1I